MGFSTKSFNYNPSVTARQSLACGKSVRKVELRGCKTLASLCGATRIRGDAALFKTWIKPLVFLGYDESERLLRIGAPNQFKLNWSRPSSACGSASWQASSSDPKPLVFEVILPSPARAAGEAAAKFPAWPCGRCAGGGNRSTDRGEARRTQAMLDKSRLRPTSRSRTSSPARPTRWHAPPRCRLWRSRTYNRCSCTAASAGQDAPDPRGGNASWSATRRRRCAYIHARNISTRWCARSSARPRTTCATTTSRSTCC